MCVRTEHQGEENLSEHNSPENEVCPFSHILCKSQGRRDTEILDVPVRNEFCISHQARDRSEHTFQAIMVLNEDH